jgi:hypothetical protein
MSLYILHLVAVTPKKGLMLIVPVYGCMLEDQRESSTLPQGGDLAQLGARKGWNGETRVKRAGLEDRSPAQDRLSAWAGKVHST